MLLQAAQEQKTSSQGTEPSWLKGPKRGLPQRTYNRALRHCPCTIASWLASLERYRVCQHIKRALLLEQAGGSSSPSMCYHRSQSEAHGKPASTTQPQQHSPHLQLLGNTASGSGNRIFFLDYILPDEQAQQGTLLEPRRMNQAAQNLRILQCYISTGFQVGFASIDRERL